MSRDAVLHRVSRQLVGGAHRCCGCMLDVGRVGGVQRATWTSIDEGGHLPCRVWPSPGCIPMAAEWTVCIWQARARPSSPVVLASVDLSGAWDRACRLITGGQAGDAS